ncbi:heavy metal sensor histidine kinase [Pseudomonas fluorescens]|uniref:heavy metal sensor histidine kinase n=1 Tax=Pseudomonas fluorescens TaxID=294 RepID=UPI00209B3E02|nr:heavy metal sensor histidine kinase [Pseudomonas fluorescens]MCO7624897.1 heavy metal sensor histidine kinase [Pseudomonas fluorescens]
MSQDSLATRLGLKVGAMSVFLVLVVCFFGYHFVARGLEQIATTALEAKMKSVSHNLSTVNNIQEVQPDAHALIDLAMGHNNLFVSIFDASSRKPIFTIGPKPSNFELHRFSASTSIIYHEWQDEDGRPMLSASQVMKLQDGAQVGTYLTIDQSANMELLRSLIRWAMISAPFLSLFIFAIAWLTVRRGLQPLTNFLNVASKISTQNLDQRLPVANLPSELRELANGINLMLHRLDGGVQQLSQFSDDLAHELRTPITNLMGKAQVTLSRERATTDYKEVLESCTEELERVTRIVSDMLFIAHVSHPASSVHFETVQLRYEAIQVMDLFGFPAEEKGLDITLSGNGEVRGNRLMIQRAISNLLSNAIRYCTVGKTVDLKIKVLPASIRLEVSNPGISISDEHLPKLFERFYRADKGRARSQGGTGLGLAIVRSIMSLHQGSAGVDNSTEGYTTFFLDFPLIRPSNTVADRLAPADRIDRQDADTM